MEITKTESSQVYSPYISVEMKAHGLEGFRHGLVECLERDGIDCESASPRLHVSIAYTRSAVPFAKVTRVASEIAQEGFCAEAGAFEILEGATTPFDYLVLALEASSQVRQVFGKVEEEFATRRFEGGFRTHVSLVRFAKGSVEAERLHGLVRELNASRGAAFALGRSLCLEGECVCVYDQSRSAVCKIACCAKDSTRDSTRDSAQAAA